MERRRFLTSAASSLPLAMAGPFAHTLQTAGLPASAAPTPAPHPHLVGAAEDRFGQMHSPGYSEILFKTSTAETPSLFAIEHTAIQPGWGPPLHVHLAQEEWFYVMEGEVLLQVGEQRLSVKPGGSILGPRNVPHAFTAVGTRPARMLIVFTPGGQMEQFFRETAGAGPRQTAEVFSRYGMTLVGAPLSGF
jgi:quercetin dioxygenase-like cupin family protein